MISCYTAGMKDEAYQLVDQLQNELDSLKHGTEADQKVLSEIWQKVPLAPWIRLKDEESVSRMPLHVDVLEIDKVGRLYNHVRKEVEDFFAGRMSIGDFHGLIMGESFTREMSKECSLMAKIYREQVKQLMEERERLEKALQQAEEELQAKRNDPEARSEVYTRRNAARSAVYAYKERFRGDFKALKSIIRSWSDGKKDNRRGWCQALHTVLCGGKGNGSLLVLRLCPGGHRQNRGTHREHSDPGEGSGNSRRSGPAGRGRTCVLRHATSQRRWDHHAARGAPDEDQQQGASDPGRPGGRSDPAVSAPRGIGGDSRREAYL